MSYDNIVALVVLGVFAAMWWFVLLGRRERQKQEAKDKADHLARVVRTFAQHIERADLDADEIRDEQELPYSNPEIAEALLQTYRSPGAVDLRDGLGVLLVTLAQYQEGVGETGLRNPISEIAKHAAMSDGEISKSSDPDEAIVEQIAAAGDSEILRRHQQFTAISLKEAQDFVDRLDAIKSGKA